MHARKIRKADAAQWVSNASKDKYHPCVLAPVMLQISTRCVLDLFVSRHT